MAEGGRETDPLIPVITKDDYNDNEGAGPSRNPFDPADHTGGDEATELHKFRSTSSRRAWVVRRHVHCKNIIYG